MIVVRAADPRAPECRALLEASQALMKSLYPAESNHYLPVQALAGPGIRFFAAELDGRVAGTGALALRRGYGEAKSMFTAPQARGRGVGHAILARLIETARAEGLTCLRLETGHTLDAAHRLYARHGFVPRGPFGDYTDDPLSLFMELAL